MGDRIFFERGVRKVNFIIRPRDDLYGAFGKNGLDQGDHMSMITGFSGD